MTTTATGLVCPKCGSPNLWDNRTTKKNPKAPDYRCKDATCDGAIWPPKGQAAPAVTAPAANVKQPLSSGPPLPWETGETTAALQKLFNVYDVCFDHAFELAHKKLGNDASHEGIAAQAATLFIAASRSNGL